jgi:FkbM family methyltransferase
MNDFYVRIVGDILINTTSSPNYLTTFVLLEQEDWFEHEIRFIRRFMRPGMRVIDIGANHGIYSLSMAKAITPGGHVWAFEPTTATAARLHKSIKRNNFENVQLLAFALSDYEGEATFYTYPNSELNSLHSIHLPEESVETVEVSTLDVQMEHLNWTKIDFVKMDAEGEEGKLITGGTKFFRSLSPLVMFEINNADATTLNAQFRSMGYEIYRLIGPDRMLVPFISGEILDEFNLNLFACKKDRALLLAEAGLLALHPEAPLAPAGAGLKLFQNQVFASAFGPLVFQDKIYAEALDAYAAWRDEQLSPNLRSASLFRALESVRNLILNSQVSIARLSSLARIAIEARQRVLALETLDRLLAMIERGEGPPAEPFFPALKRYDKVDPRISPQLWFAATVREAIETLRFWSSYFERISQNDLKRRDWLLMTPFASAPIERRRQLIRFRLGQKFSAASLLAHEGRDNLNPEFWINSPVA